MSIYLSLSAGERPKRMFLSKEMNTEKEITALIALIIFVFIMFVGALVTLLYKLVYAHLEYEFKIQHQLTKPTGIRPISAILSPQLNSQLDMMYENRRGAVKPIRQQKRLSLDKSFVQNKKVEFV